MIVTLFWSELRDGMDDATRARYEADNARLRATAEESPGFVSVKSFTADDGERLTVVMFEDDESQRRWRSNRDHATTQQFGRDRYYARYRSMVLSSMRDTSFPRGEVTR